MTETTRTIEVNYLARVEGEGALHLAIDGGQLTAAQLRIFEPPRFFEALLRGRDCREAPDITARICGICPVAYLMSSCAAIEDLCGVSVPAPVADLRRLLYCGEWIESHVLHMFMLHLPDFLGYPDAVSMAREHGDLVRTALRIKKAGNGIVALLGGREIHPINVRIGGFYRLPTRAELAPLRDELRLGARRRRAGAGAAGGARFPGLRARLHLRRPAPRQRVPDGPRSAGVERRRRPAGRRLRRLPHRTPRPALHLAAQPHRRRRRGAPGAAGALCPEPRPPHAARAGGGAGGRAGARWCATRFAASWCAAWRWCWRSKRRCA